MRTIDFFLIGAQKTGTSTLGLWLAAHPQISMSSLHENAWFVEDHLYRRGESWLERSYAGAEDRPVWGLAHVHMLQSSVAMARIEAHNPRPRVLAVFRNPIDRAWSAYWFARRSGWERSATFEEALDREPERWTRYGLRRAEFAYVANGDYATWLAPWIERFGRDRVHVVLTDDIQARPREVLADTLAFLGLDRDGADGIDVAATRNESAWPRFPALQAALMSRDGLHKRLARAVIPPAVRVGMWESVLYPATMYWNLVPHRNPPMEPATRERLAERFSDGNRRLGDLIGRDLPNWR